MIGIGRLTLSPARDGSTPEDMAVHDGIDFSYMDWLNQERDSLSDAYLEAKAEQLPPSVIAEALAAFNKIKSQIKDANELAPYVDDEIAKLASGKPSALRFDMQFISKSGAKRYTYLSVKECERKIRTQISERNSSGRKPKFPAQQKAILDELRRHGYDPLSLPKDDPGKPGITELIRNALVGPELFKTEKAFERVWGKLSKAKIIVKKK